MFDLSPFLNKGLTTTYFKRSAKIPEDLLYIWVMSELMKVELIFSNLLDIPSYPEKFLDLRDFIIFSTSLVDKDFRLILGNGNNLSDVFPVRNGLKQGYALSPLLINFALEHTIGGILVNQDGLKLNGTHQLLVYHDNWM
jgi:hypothetical protein